MPMYFEFSKTTPLFSRAILDCTGYNWVILYNLFKGIDVMTHATVSFVTSMTQY